MPVTPQTAPQLELEVVPGKVCKNEQQLFDSEHFQTVLVAYNACRANQKEPLPLVTAEQVRGDYNLATDVKNFFDVTFKLSGATSPRIGSTVERVSALVVRVLADVKFRDKVRVLSRNEITERLKPIGTLEGDMRNIQLTYVLGGTTNLVTHQAQQVLRSLREGDMQVIEQQLRNGSSSNFIIDFGSCLIRTDCSLRSFLDVLKDGHYEPTDRDLGK
ncbi:MAG: hypothetical protein AAB588_00015 [Patescibacteria group bacterium]